MLLRMQLAREEPKVRNRVGKQIVFVLLALLLVFGVATSAGAEVYTDESLVKYGTGKYFLYQKGSDSFDDVDLDAVCARLNKTAGKNMAVPH